LATQVPALERHMPPLHPLHIEPNSGYGAARGGQPRDRNRGGCG
jgi:hypothetical protein